LIVDYMLTIAISIASGVDAVFSLLPGGAPSFKLPTELGLGGRVALLVVLYSINVFLTFSFSLLGLCIYWWHARQGDPRWHTQ
jgi:hypothetical protein